jgi:hypothetical protein
MAPLALAAHPEVESFFHAAYEQAVASLQMTRIITVPCGCKMTLFRLFGRGKDNIRA